MNHQTKEDRRSSNRLQGGNEEAKANNIRSGWILLKYNGWLHCLQEMNLDSWQSSPCTGYDTIHSSYLHFFIFTFSAFYFICFIFILFLLSNVIYRISFTTRELDGTLDTRCTTSILLSLSNLPWCTCMHIFTRFFSDFIIAFSPNPTRAGLRLACRAAAEVRGSQSSKPHESNGT